METAIVILNWNGRKHLENFLPSVVKNSGNASIYVADNASTDESVAFVKNTYPQIKIVQNQENGGFAKGYNEALAQIKADYYVLLNSDVEVSDNWVDPIIDYMQQNKIEIAQPKILSYKEKDSFEYAGAAGGFIDFLGYPFCQGRIFQSLEKDKGQYNNIKEVFWATGACQFIKAELFHELGGFDERYFAHMEEIDLCWRAKNRGHRVFYIPLSTVYHLGGGTMQNSNPRKTFLNFRNSLLTLYKNDSSNYTILKIFMRLLLDGLAFIKLLFESGPTHAFAILKAHISFYAMPKKRPERNVKDNKGMYKGSIAWAYFFRKEKSFSQLKKGFMD